jgi:hypothetical protein
MKLILALAIVALPLAAQAEQQPTGTPSWWPYSYLDNEANAILSAQLDAQRQAAERPIDWNGATNAVPQELLACASFPAMKRLADRLGVKPVDHTKPPHSHAWIVESCDGEYDLTDVMNAFLDRLDAKAAKSP